MLRSSYCILALVMPLHQLRDTPGTGDAHREPPQGVHAYCDAYCLLPQVPPACMLQPQPLRDHHRYLYHSIHTRCNSPRRRCRAAQTQGWAVVLWPSLGGMSAAGGHVIRLNRWRQGPLPSGVQRCVALLPLEDDSCMLQEMQVPVQPSTV
jgi:hypothetical protein